MKRDFNTIAQILDHWPARFMNLLSGNYSLQDILDTGSEMLGNPLYLVDSSGKCIGITKGLDLSDDIVWNELSTAGYISYDTFMSDSEHNLLCRLDRSDSPFLWTAPNYKYRRYIGKIRFGNTHAGTLNVAEYKKPFTENDFYRVSHLCDILNIELQKHEFISHTNKSLYESILAEFISGKAIKNEIKAVEEKRKILNLTSKSVLCLITIDVSLSIDGSQISLNNMSRIIENIFVNSRTVIYNGLITLLLNSEKNNYFFKNELRILKEFFEGKKIYAGVSRCFYLLENIHEYYLQSVSALKWSRLAKEEPLICLYEDSAIYHIADVCSRNGALTKYCHPSLLLLMEYDSHNSTHFTQTLYTYLDCFKNITLTSKALNIHRNTLIYRIEKLQEIMNEDLDNSNTILQIQLSFKILEYDKLNSVSAFKMYDNLP